MLTIENINKLAGKCIGEWKIDSMSLGFDIYYIKVFRTTSPNDVYNLMIDRRRTKHGDYRISCFETGRDHYLPIECMKDSDEFIRFLMAELT